MWARDSSNGTWSLQAQLTLPNPGPVDAFGVSVALNYDGSVAWIGAPWRAVSGAQNQGAVYAWRRTGTNWSIIAEYSAYGAGELGTAVALSIADGVQRGFAGAPKTVSVPAGKCHG